MEIIIQIGLLALGFAMLGKGADWFVEGAAGIASRFGISQMVIGLTIIAMGTSAPEAAVSISSAMAGSADITIGNIVGSNIMNILVILGITAAIKPLPVERNNVMIEIPYMIAITVLLFILGKDGFVNRIDGIVLWVCFILYTYYCYKSTSDKDDEDADDVHGFPLGQTLAWMLGGMLLIVLGSNISVDAAVAIAKALGVSQRIIGLTIVALGTSLPELFTSVVAALKGNSAMAVGNIVGSNIFNILFVVGSSALLIPVPFSQAFMLDMYIAIAAAILLEVCIAFKYTLARWAGILMLALYSIYLWRLL